LVGAPFPARADLHIFATEGDVGMDHDSYDDRYIRGILNTVKTIAMVGVSANTSRPSYFAFKYLLERGYGMIPINPGLEGQDLLGRKVRSEEHTSELQSLRHLVCRLLLEKKKTNK